ncbi:MAG: efflux RND transporter periplasmic adaptor subunit [Sulfurimonas sp.]|uniref:efflux RND transporter periplasmic adaptor subunit n=1 Tax=Sulfurimonas sp. TaxID=2022749 RepID=UPI002614754C|nr:efflux RND transporter periplasmic adaptor subunit [Sulfurimonas sp.]MDD5373586.1 efflux RND transporter periplasmic adaptor subunit [Sulfurimonas sp.]
MIKIFLGIVFLIISANAQEIYANFFVEAHKSANLALDAGGIIKKVYVDISHKVKKGDKLVELANDDIKASLDIVKSEVANAEVVFKYAKKDYERQEKVKHLVDEARFDVYALAYEKAKTALELAKANLAYKQTLYDKTVLYAPFDGVIFEKTVEVGDVVTEMSPKTILKIQSQNDRKLVLEFDQKYWKEVKVGQTFNYKIDGDEKEHKSVITKVYPHVNAQSRKLSAEVEAKDFLVGLFGDGYIDSKK